MDFNKKRNYKDESCKTFFQYFAIFLIRFYQLTLSSFIGNNCRYLPTCSEYSYEAIIRYGVITGIWLTILRIIRCSPFGGYGFDPVPVNLKKRMLLLNLKKILQKIMKYLIFIK